MSSNIPAAREMIKDLIDAGGVDVHDIKLVLEQDILPLLHRTRTKKVIARRECVKVDAKLAAIIRDYADLYPKASQLNIANRFGTNPGRVSEAIAGLR
jgi:hypothetical protein